MVFSVPSFLSVGDDYDATSRVVDQRSKGRNFVAVAPKKGKLPDALFEHEFHSIHEGDPYVDQLVRERADRNAKTRGALAGAPPFRCTNPPKKSTGRGMHFGTFAKVPLPHETDYVVPKKGEVPPKKEPGRRPIFTAPAKKGTFGVPGTTLSSIGEDYISDQYDRAQQQERERQRKHRELCKGGAFKPTGRTGALFDEGAATGASAVYKMTKPMAPRKVRPPPPPPKGRPEAAWKPVGTGQKTFIPKVEYREDPHGGADPREPPKKKAASDKKAFMPSGVGNNTWYTKSIAFARL